MDSAYKTTGATFKPLRFNIYRGPNITTSSTLSATHGSAYSHDFYPECDVGIVIPKTMSITGLPAGLTDNGNGTVTGTPTSAGNTNITISCTNNAGQQAQKSVQLQVT